jgi:hypothetical protein
MSSISAGVPSRSSPLQSSHQLASERSVSGARARKDDHARNHRFRREVPGLFTKTCPDQDRLRPTTLHNRRHAASDSHSASARPIVRNLWGSIGVDVAVVNPRKRHRGDGARMVAVDATVRRPVVPEPQTKAPKARVCRSLSRSVRWVDGGAGHGFVSVACQLCCQSRRELAGQRTSRTLPLSAPLQPDRRKRPPCTPTHPTRAAKSAARSLSDNAQPLHTNCAA